MDTVEVVIYIVIAFIAGGLVLGFITQWHYEKTYELLKKSISNQQSTQLKEITKEEFVTSIFNLFDQCKETENRISANYYVKGSGSFGKAELFDIVKQLNWCSTIQSAESGCGTREDVVFQEQIILPSIVKVECAQQIIYIQ